MAAAPRDRVRSRRERRSLMARSRAAVSIYRLLSDGSALCELLFYSDSALLVDIARLELDAGISRMRICWAGNPEASPSVSASPRGIPSTLGSVTRLLWIFADVQVVQ